jgi:uncharacterized membrane protein
VKWRGDQVSFFSGSDSLPYRQYIIMKKIASHLRNTVIAGIVLLIPVFVIIVIIQNMYGKLTGFGKQLSAFLGIKSVAGIGAASIATTLILIVLFYAFGLLVQVSLVTRFKNWIENNLLQYIPGYLGYKVKMEEKLMPKGETKIAALVTVGEIIRPGFLMHRSAGKCVVFIPNTPDTNTGEVWVVEEGRVKELGVADQAFVNSIRHSGKGMEIPA